MSNSYVQQARSIRQQPSIVETFEDIPDDFQCGRKEYMATLDSFRPELYAVAAVIADEAVDHAVEREGDFPKFVIDTRVAPLDLSFSSLAAHMRSYLADSVRLRLEEMETEKSPVLMRLEGLCKLFHHDYESRYGTPETLILAGVGTAGTETAYALRAVRYIVLKEEPHANTGETAEVAKASKRFMRRIASVNVEHLGAVSKLVRIAGQLPLDEYDGLEPLFQGVNPEGIGFVDFAKPLFAYPNLVSDDGTTIGDIPIQLTTIGCPARAKLNGMSSIDKLWAWAIDLAYEAGLFEPELKDRDLWRK
jgi:hypothetical protein